MVILRDSAPCAGSLRPHEAPAQEGLGHSLPEGPFPGPKYPARSSISSMMCTEPIMHTGMFQAAYPQLDQVPRQRDGAPTESRFGGRVRCDANQCEQCITPRVCERRAPARCSRSSRQCVHRHTTERSSRQPVERAPRAGDTPAPERAGAFSSPPSFRGNVVSAVETRRPTA